MKPLSLFAACSASWLAVSAATFVDPSAYLAGTSPSDLAGTTVATGTSLPVRSSTATANGKPGAVAYFNTRTGQLSLDPKGWPISLFNFTYTTGTNNTTAATPGPFRYASGTSPSSLVISGATGSANQRTLPAGTWTLITAHPARVAGTVSLTRTPTLATSYDDGNGAGSATTPYSTAPSGASVVGGWFTQPWAFPADFVDSTSLSTMTMGNWKTFGVSGNLNSNVLGYGNNQGTFQYVIDGVVGNQVGPVIPYTDPVPPTVVPPTVGTPTSDAITATGATLGGNVTADGNGTVTERGVVYSLTSVNPTPEINGTGVTKVSATSAGTGAFTADVTGLLNASSYTFRAYAINGAGTSYSGAGTFTTFSSNATLSGLSVSGSGAILSPAFASLTADYSVQLRNPVDAVTVTPTASFPSANIRVRIRNGTFVPVASGAATAPLSLDVGANPVDVEVTAQDGLTVQTYTVTVTRLSALLTWKLDNHGSTANSGASADLATPAGDNLTNLEKYAFGLDPNQPTPGLLAVSGNSITARGKPVMAVVTSPTSVGMRARFVRRKTHASDGLTFAVQFSPDMTSWQTSAATPVVVASDADFEVVEIPYPLFLNGRKAGFFRVNVGIN